LSSSRYRLFVLIFTLSGFAGLIYESIWSHYLQLLLGHAAYAQTMVLIIFMGGMALGSKLAARWFAKSDNLLILYVLIEGALAVFALVFHRLFLASGDLLHETVIPQLDTPLLINTAKWVIGTSLILPQSILLGMTFPVMCAAMLRQRPYAPGAIVSTLYFCNSLGAAVGVLVSGFWLIATVGLPGTVMTAGLINAAIALTVWGLFKLGTTGRAPAHDGAGLRSDGHDAWYRPLLIASALTGLSSFIYEIGWIRMLSMVLGSATHSFELMLSAFITGLALGGFWLRKRIDNLRNPLAFLAGIQIFMGVLALWSMSVYGYSFDVMQWLLRAVQHSPDGYVLYMCLSHGLVLLVMLPATFCAGMTLPLITHELLRRNEGERSIGHVYAANTMGAIFGVLFVVHIGMPMLGLKGAMIAGATVDIGIGLAITFTLRRQYPAWRTAIGAILGAGAIAVTLMWVHLDPYRMASGVYRYGVSSLPASVRMLYNRDGKTATINVREVDANLRAIAINGKPDAAINMRPGSDPTEDEVTMVMLAAIPLAMHPAAQVVANIGMGSGLTTSTLLASPRIRQVDTVEIEAAVTEGAKNFLPRVERTYTDPRGHIYIDDAKAFFASRGTRYDAIISEPSNPWVSGVAGLFTDEFYWHIRRYLNPGGLYVQWLQVYEIDTGLVTSVMKAMGRNFQDYAIYATNHADLLIVAAKDRKLSDPSGSIFDQPLLAAELKRVGIANLRDLQLHRIGNKQMLGPLFDAYPEPVNSDYFPYLDLHADRSRFLNQNALAIVGLSTAPVPLLRWLDPVKRWDNLPTSPPIPTFTIAANAAASQAGMLANILIGNEVADVHHENALSSELQTAVEMVLNGHLRCHNPQTAEIWLQSIRKISNATFPMLSPEQSARLADTFRHSACVPQLSIEREKWLELFEAVGHANVEKSASLAAGILQVMDVKHSPEEDLGYVVALAMAANLAMNKPREALEIWTQYAAGRWRFDNVNIYLQLLYAMATRDDAAT
jgi:spermidine synthase